eukprot:CAMPEP_0195516320 /NCGR_PEP_ID=MMETSP0794_2-20130614/7085_1 /TAXON_ID=515487 /ORGANISM="Stephanopyxis turris, Strain CCMP 815" /LENGTH=205 /DNA_ID=CAMNT_0040644885 /DNA_START=158 /DNA_END=771 /DNA_ORIENTATION=-
MPKRPNKNIRADVRSYRLVKEGSKPKVEYQLVCCFKAPTLEKSVITWEVWKRYSQFNDLDSVLRKKWADMNAVTFPGKKVFGALDPAFLDKRLGQLSEYVQALLQIDNIADFHKPHISSNELRHFMNFDTGSQAKKESGSRTERRESKAGKSRSKTPRSGGRTARMGRRRSSVAARNTKKKDPYANATNYVLDTPAAAPAPAPAP